MSYNTLSYADDVKGWPSFYSYGADYMIGMNGYFYTWSGGNLYRHNTNTLRNNYYGVQYNSEITSVFNEAPSEIKLFKTMSYESDARWECESLFTDLSTGSMLSTYFQQKEGEWFTFLRENTGTLNLKDRSVNGIGTANTVNGPVNAVVIEFTVDVGTIASIGDEMYWAPATVFPAPAGTPTLGGVITNIVATSTTTPLGVTTPSSITVDCTTGTPPAVGNFILFVKDPVAESHGARGYFMHFKLKNVNTSAVELFSVGSDVMKSFP
tara:strand:+ start:902 stop:1702 length:801 start_codon:yes stop_codon:yes gene_type:complete